jgi:hypothetical protein
LGTFRLEEGQLRDPKFRKTGDQLFHHRRLGKTNRHPERMHWPRILVHTLDASKIAFDCHFGHLPGPIEQLGFMAAPTDGAEVPNFLGGQGHHPTHFKPLV